MDLSTLKPAKGSVQKKKRLGRGQGSGRGGTSTKGHKGAQSRSGYKRKVGFEGGQMPIQRRLPKGGFKNINRVEYKVINLGRLQEIAEKSKLSKIDIAAFKELGLLSKTDKLKILGRGELKAKLDLEVNAASVSAKEAIEKLGGTIKLI